MSSSSESPTCPIVAFHEQPSFDPETGIEGVLRKEWRLVSFYSYPIKLALQTFGAHCVHAAKSPKFILERRYIRRGTVEPWEAVDLYETEEQAYYGLDRPHTALSETFISIQAENERIRAEIKQEEDRQRELEYERTEKRRLRAKADDAFIRLRDESGESGKALCEAWNTFCSSVSDENRDAYANDPRFMSLYNAAYDSYKLPSKRKAMREFLAYVGGLPNDTKATRTDLDLQVFS